MSSFQVALILFGLFFALLMLRVPVAFALGLACVPVFFIDERLTPFLLLNEMLKSYNSFLLLAIPFFLLAANLMNAAGITEKLITLARTIVGHLPGGLGHVNVVVSMLFAGISGSSTAETAGVGGVLIPAMKKQGFDARFTVALTACASVMGVIIPPSILMVVWGILTEQSIGHLFLAGVIPGLILAGLMAVHVLGVYFFKPEWLGEGKHAVKPAVGADDMGRAILGERAAPTPGQLVFSLFGFFAIIMGALGGIWLGFFTPTEGAGMGALIALVISLMKGMRWAGIKESVLAVGRTATPLLIIVFSAQLYSRTLSMSGIGLTLQTGMLESGLPNWGIVLFMIFVWFVLGMLIDSISIMLLTVPIFAPVAQKLGLDPLVFAMVGILVIEAGLLTPPFGIIVYAVKAVIGNEDVQMGKIFIASTPFWVYLLLINILLFAFPGIATYLPRAL